MININTIKELYDKNTPSMQTVQLVREALELFDSSRSSAIVIIDDKKYPTGILTERDITKYAGHWDEILSLPVSKVMSSPVTTIGQEHDFRDAYMQMSENGFRHLVVVKEDGSLAGILDEGHFLRHLTPEQLLAVKEVKLVMSKNVTTVEINQSTAETIKRMTESKISSIIIVRDKKPLGIFTERDSIRLARHGDAILEAPISEHMTSPLKTIHEEKSVIDAEHMLTHQHIRHLVVVNDKGELSGIVSQHDLVKGISGIYVEMLRNTIRRQSKLLHKTYNRLEEQSVLNNILNSFSDRLIIACDLNSVIEFTNADIYQCLNTVPQIGKKLDESIQCFDSSISDSILNAELTSIINSESIVSDSKGKKHYFKTSYSPIFSKNKLLQGFLFTAKDVTSEKLSLIRLEKVTEKLKGTKKLLEEQNLLLQERERQLLQAQTIAKIGNWSLDIATMQAYWSEEIRDIVGIETDIDVGPEFLSKIIIPTDWPIFECSLTEAIKEGKPHNIEYRIERPSNHEIRWVNCRAIRILDDNKQPIKLVGTVQDITEKKEQELKIMQQEALFRAIFEQASVGVAQIDSKTGQFIKVNQTYADIVGRSVEEMSNIDFMQITHPDDLEEYLKIIQTLKNASIPHYSKRKRYYKPDGDIVWVNLHVSPLYRKDGEPESHIAIVVDLTKQISFEEQLKDAKKQFQQFYYKTPVMMHAMGKDFKLKEVSNRWLEILGYTREEVIGHDITEFQTIESTKRVKEVYMPELMQTGELRGGELEFYRKNGKIAYLELNAIPEFDEKGEFLHGLGFLIDVTELHEKDKILLLQSRQAAMGEMISMIAHQWRQPLGVVSMIVNNLLLDIKTNMFDAVAAKEDFVEINDQLQYMSATIDDFRNFFKPSKEVEQDSILNILQDIMKIIGPSLDSNSIQTEIECDSTLMVQTYKSELKQVIINILSNAKDALKDTQVENKMIKISVKAENEHIMFSIFNNGPKIDSKLLHRVFEPYFTTKEILGGTGIGLYMSKSIIEKHMYGNIEAKNLNEGVKFTIRIPEILEGTIDE